MNSRRVTGILGVIAAVIAFSATGTATTLSDVSCPTYSLHDLSMTYPSFIEETDDDKLSPGEELTVELTYNLPACTDAMDAGMHNFSFYGVAADGSENYLGSKLAFYSQTGNWGSYSTYTTPMVVPNYTTTSVKLRIDVLANSVHGSDVYWEGRSDKAFDKVLDDTIGADRFSEVPLDNDAQQMLKDIEASSSGHCSLTPDWTVNENNYLASSEPGIYVPSDFSLNSGHEDCYMFSAYEYVKAMYNWYDYIDTSGQNDDIVSKGGTCGPSPNRRHNGAGEVKGFTKSWDRPCPDKYGEWRSKSGDKVCTDGEIKDAEDITEETVVTIQPGQATAASTGTGGGTADGTGDGGETAVSADTSVTTSDGTTLDAVTGVDADDDEIMVEEDVTDQIEAGSTIDVTGTENNDGTYTVESASYGGGQDKTTIAVTEDLTAPSDTETTVEAVTSVDTADNTVTLDGNWEDALSSGSVISLQGEGTEDGTYTVQDASYDAGTGETTVTVSEDLTATASDPIQLWNNGTHFVRDGTSPTVSVEATSGSLPTTSWTSSPATVTTSCTDDGVEQAIGCDSTTYRLKIYDHGDQPATCPVQYSEYDQAPPQTVSSHAWVCAAAQDQLGNVGVGGASPEPVELKVDTTSPTIDVTTTSPTSNDTEQVHYNVTDPTLDQCTASGAGVSWSCSESDADGDGVEEGTCSPDASIADGDHTVTVECTDVAGNIGSASVNLVVDTTAPSLSCTDCDTPDPIRSGNDLLFQPSVGDATTNVSRVEVCEDVGGSPHCDDLYCSGTTSCSYTTPGNTYDTRSYWIRATDTVGNTAGPVGPNNFTVKKWVGDPCSSDEECLMGVCSTSAGTVTSVCSLNVVPEPGIILE